METNESGRGKELGHRLKQIKSVAFLHPTPSYFGWSFYPMEETREIP